MNADNLESILSFEEFADDNQPEDQSRAAQSQVYSSEAFQAFCQQLADDYASDGQSRLLRWAPLALLVIGAFLAFSLIYVDLRWFFFGPAFAIAGVLMLVISGACQGGPLIRQRLVGWFQGWPIWEFVVAGAGTISMMALSVVYGFWPALFMGAIVGCVVASILVLLIMPKIQQRRTELADQFATLVLGVERQGIGLIRIQEGMPALMGNQWIALFEHHFGYQAYRSVAMQLRTVQPTLLEQRPKVRDFICDVLKRSRMEGRGILGTLICVRQEYWDSRLATELLSQIDPVASVDRGRNGTMAFEVTTRRDIGTVVTKGEVMSNSSGPVDVAQPLNRTSFGNQDLAGHGLGANAVDETTHVNAHLHAPNINIGSLHATSVSFQVSKEELNAKGVAPQFPPVGAKRNRKAEYDQMLQDAWSSRTRRSKRFPRLQKWLGEEARMTLGIAFLFLFGAYLVDAGLFSSGKSQEFIEAYQQHGVLSFQGLQRTSSAVVQSLASLPATPSLIKISGWSLGLVGVLFGLTGFLRDGWPMTLFVGPAAILTMLMLTLAIEAESLGAMCWMTGVSVLIFLLAGVALDRKVPNWLSKRTTQDRSEAKAS
ncbi:hypothetical protein SAMN06265222_101300 [Neorhodopirellula lusitana]|uniref:Uncharacterized protein n=1 Tax=Neorhodopirellula lusitana TaxID=445327 RepID=A0ABY1PR99_9BACT|nr:hypothetical protein [Neorhodopirellula lusitana]SMP39378.1 hypothetical protein SAMN06265222_101300 [Neorhodopirellula lusitana]